jgi:hypothetical protein
MQKSLRRAAMAALVIFAVVPGMASAALTPTVSVVGVQAGCQPKGALAIPLPGSGVNPPGAISYKITATVNGTETAPCAALPAGAPVASGTFLQWQAAPGATNYKIYRNDQLLTTLTPAQVGAFGITCAPTNAASRCQALDSGGATTAAAPPALPSVITQAGSHPDFNITQTFDYAAGADPDPNGNTNTADATPDSASLKDNILHFPAGLLANPTATDATCSITQLIGAPATATGGAGATDPGEDACPRASQVGTVIAAIQSAPSGPSNPPTPTIGDIYIGQKLNPADNVTARLFVALRPPCSAGYPAPLNPGGAQCNARLGGANREVEKSFLSAKATIRQDGTYGIDNETTSVATGADEDLAAVSNVRSSTNGAVLTGVPIQVRSLTQNLWGNADQGTVATGDDRSFVSLPTSCASKTFSTDQASYLNPVLVSASTSLQASGCGTVPFSPEISAIVDTNGQTGQNKHPGFVATIVQSADEAATKTAVVTLPEGLGTNLDALARACTIAQQTSVAGCPTSSAVGFATATTAVLPGTLAGPVYLAENNSPYNVTGLPKLIVALDGPAKITFDGAISFNATNTRLVNTFDNLPEVPLGTFSLAITGGTGGLLQNTRNLCTSPLGNLDAAFVGYNGGTAAMTAPVVSNQAYYCVTPPPKTKKIKPGLSLKIKPKTDKKKPFKFTVSGKVNRKSAPKKKACKGKVVLRVNKGHRKGKLKVKVNSSCKYKAKITLNKRKAGNKGNAKFKAQFLGNSVLKKSAVKKKTVKYGKKAKKHKKGNK